MVVFCRLIMRNTSWKKELGKAFVSFRSKFSGAFSVCHAFGNDNHKGGLCMNMREYHWHWDNFDALHSGYALRWTDHHHHSPCCGVCGAGWCCGGGCSDVG